MAVAEAEGGGGMREGREAQRGKSVVVVIAVLGGAVGAALSVVHDVTAMSGVVTDAAAVEVSIAVPC